MKSELGIDLRMYRMSGIGRYLQTIMPVMVPLLDVARIRVFGKPSDLSHEVWASDPRIKVEDYRARIFSISEQLQGAWKFRNVDLLWVPHYNISLLHRGRSIVTIHDLCQLALPELLGSTVQRRYAKLLLLTASRRADAILCVSNFTRDEIVRRLHIDGSRIIVTYPGKGIAERDVKVDLVCREGRPYILAVGNVKPHKNLSKLVDAFSKVQNTIPHDLVIVGKREGFLNSDTSLAQSCIPLGERIGFTGEVSDEELLGYYRNADALVFPSLYEGFGFPILEAMSQGCPVACSSTASLPEVAGDAALLFDPYSADEIAKAMVSIVTNYPLREKLIARGFQRIESFSAEYCGRRTAEAINAILSQ